jgi:hypothetical protein
MRLFLTVLSFITLLAAAPVAHAEETGETDTFKVMDVRVDVTADTAAHARDQAILQAQRSAFTELAIRLGIEGKAPQPDDATLANLVQGFEVQNERSSSIRYLGLMTVQFKPGPTRAFLGRTGAAYSETRSRPMLILPIIAFQGHDTLFEDKSLWRMAWDETPKQAGLVPLVLPLGDATDAALAGAPATLATRADALAALARKYQAAGGMVATLAMPQDPMDGKSAPTITLVRFDAAGKMGDTANLTLPPAGDEKALTADVAEGVKLAKTEIEKAWRQATKALRGPASHLSVVAPVATLAAWNATKAHLGNVFGVSKVTLLGLARDAARIDLAYHGEIPALQTAMSNEGLSLDQTPDGWIVRSSMP